MSAKIHEAMAAVMNDLGAIAKTDRNDYHNYKFRGIDSVMNALHDVLAKHNVFVYPEVLEANYEQLGEGGKETSARLRVAYHFTADDGSEVVAIGQGEGYDKGDKSSNKAMSGALKYVLLQTFMVPTEDVDEGDSESPERSAPPQRPRSVPTDNGAFEQQSPPQQNRRQQAADGLVSKADNADWFRRYWHAQTGELGLSDAEKHALLRAHYGVGSSNDLDSGQRRALVKLIGVDGEGDRLVSAAKSAYQAEQEE